VGEKLIEAKESGDLAGHGGDRKSSSRPSNLMRDLDGTTADERADWQRRARTPFSACVVMILA
jgi:hypothetical protein